MEDLLLLLEMSASERSEEATETSQTWPCFKAFCQEFTLPVETTRAATDLVPLVDHLPVNNTQATIMGLEDHKVPSGATTASKEVLLQSGPVLESKATARRLEVSGKAGSTQTSKLANDTYIAV